MSKKAHKKTFKKASKTAAGKPASGRSKASAKKPAAKKGRMSGAKPGIVKTAKPRTVAKVPVAASKPASKAAAKSKVAAKSETRPAKDAAAAPAGRAPLAEGAKAPSFRLPRDGGETISLADFAGQRLVLFFYPRADTPGCTREAIDFTRLAKSFADCKTAVVGVSADPLKAQESFRNKHQLTTPLASDEKHETLLAYGAWGEKSMYGKTFFGVLRTTVLIGADAQVEKIWRQVKVDGHADEVLETVRAS